MPVYPKATSGEYHGEVDLGHDTGDPPLPFCLTGTLRGEASGATELPFTANRLESIPQKTPFITSDPSPWNFDIDSAYHIKMLLEAMNKSRRCPGLSLVAKAWQRSSHDTTKYELVHKLITVH